MKKKRTESLTDFPKSVIRPATDHEKNKVQIFSSFEEMNEADAKEMANTSPLENLKNATAYIMHVYAEELKKKMTDLAIHLKANGYTNPGV